MVWIKDLINYTITKKAGIHFPLLYLMFLVFKMYIHMH